LIGLIKPSLKKINEATVARSFVVREELQMIRKLCKQIFRLLY